MTDSEKWYQPELPFDPPLPRPKNTSNINVSGTWGWGTTSPHDGKKRGENPQYSPNMFPIHKSPSKKGRTSKDRAREVADKAVDAVTGPRNVDYGHPLDDFSKVAKMWSGIFGVDVTPEQVAMAMICIKIARELNLPKEDNALDGIGYWMALEMLKEERKRRSNNE